MSPEQEQRLADALRAALAGDDVAYAAFLRDVASVLRTSIRRRAGTATRVEPEDVVQEALLAIHLKRHTWRQDSAVGPWIHAIARHKLVDAQRRRRRGTELDIADFAETLSGGEAEEPIGRDIARALSGLSDGQRRVVSAISVEGHSIAEAAARLGMKENAVRVALHRGLAAIAARFRGGDA